MKNHKKPEYNAPVTDIIIGNPLKQRNADRYGRSFDTVTVFRQGYQTTSDPRRQRAGGQIP